jgi:hypothetical protein
MPSDDGGARGFGDLATTLPDALRGRAEEFRSRLALASEEVRDWRIHHEEAVADPASVLGAELGRFAEGRIDPARLAGLVGVEESPDPVLHHLVALAEDRFGRLLRRGSDAFFVGVPPGGDLRDAVRDALADLGTAFGFARAVRKARTRRFLPDDDHELLRPWPFHRWSPAELEMAPPLVIELDGSDLRAAGLSEFLDGGVRMVLRVRERTGPAPLARLISPGVFVAQVSAASPDPVLERLASWDGPGIVGLFEPDAGALEYVHDPGSGLEVDLEEVDIAIAEASDRRGTPGLGELRHLRRFVAPAPPVADSAADPGTDSGDPETPLRSSARGAVDDVDRLAGWLLSNLPADADEG